MTEQHTAGPWCIAYDDANGQAVISGEHTEVATCWHHCVGSLEKQMRANARLIAAAPDLLKSLTDLLDDGHSFESEGMARDAARAAIAKATA
jgi:hypothetical protein